MSLLIILRHGQRTDHKDTPTYNPELSPVGLAQATEAAAQIAHHLERANLPVEIRSSPHLRCIQTASQIGEKLQCLVAVDHGLTEWLHLGLRYTPPYDGGWSLAEDAAAAAQRGLIPKEFTNPSMFANSPTDTGIPAAPLGPELYSDYRHRLNAHLAALTRANEAPRALILVTHGIAVNCFLLFLTNGCIFQEVPEAALSVAREVAPGQWLLESNCVGLVNRPDNFSILGNPSDYITNYAPPLKADPKKNVWGASGTGRTLYGSSPAKSPESFTSLEEEGLDPFEGMYGASLEEPAKTEAMWFGANR